MLITALNFVQLTTSFFVGFAVFSLIEFLSRKKHNCNKYCENALSDAVSENMNLLSGLLIIFSLFISTISHEYLEIRYRTFENGKLVFIIITIKNESNHW